MLKKYELHDRTGQPLVDRDIRRESNHGPVGCSSSKTWQWSCVLQDIKIHESRCTSRIHSRPKSFARIDLPRWTSSAQPQRSKIWGSVSGRDRVARARCQRSSVEAGQKCVKIKGENRATFFSPSENRCLPASTLKLEERKFVVDSGASMHMISNKEFNDAEMDILNKSCSPTRVKTANGEVQTHEEATVYVKELDIFLTMKVLETRQHYCRLGSFAMISLKNGIRIQCNTENFVPIVVPGLSTSCSSGSYHSTSRTPSRQENDHPTSSSSSSSSPTATSSDSETREKEDRTESDTSSVPVSSFNVDDRTGTPSVDQANQNTSTVDLAAAVPETSHHSSFHHFSLSAQQVAGRGTRQRNVWKDGWRSPKFESVLPDLCLCPTRKVKRSVSDAMLSSHHLRDICRQWCLSSHWWQCTPGDCECCALSCVGDRSLELRRRNLWTGTSFETSDSQSVTAAFKTSDLGWGDEKRWDTPWRADSPPVNIQHSSNQHTNIH